MSDRLLPDESLGPDEFLSSSNGRFTFVYQGDGNLVFYRTGRGGRKALWHSQTNGKPVGRCIMQGDGNLVIYGPNDEYVWDTATDGYPGSKLTVRNSGVVDISDADEQSTYWYKAGDPLTTQFAELLSATGNQMLPGEVLWPDESLSSANGQYTLIFQSDGNLVLYRNQDGTALWASGTHEMGEGLCFFIGDSLSLLRNNPIFWVPGLGVGPIYWLIKLPFGCLRVVVRDDGNLAIYGANPNRNFNIELIWSTNTQQNAPAPPPPAPILRVNVTPYPVPLGRAVTVTVNASDPATSSNVAGQVTINGQNVATTNTPFTYTFTARRILVDPEPPRRFEMIYPEGAVNALGYPSSSIGFGFRDV